MNPGERAGKYEFQDRLGKGGMGEVWRAWDAELNRPVAIKLLKDATADDLARFNREAQTAARLHHPGIASVFELGRHKDEPFIAMQYIEGETLAALADAGPLPIRDAAEIVRDAALAIDAAHAALIVHRDVKPQNIMIAGAHLVAEEGRPLRAVIPRPLRVFVMDFGLAKSTESGGTISMTGELMGTPAYMAPEQADGAKHLIGPASDVYALGATLYEAVTSSPPFRGENPARILMQVLDHEPAAPRRLNPRVHPDIETIVLKAMDKNPSRRYTSAKALAGDLDRFLAGEPILARPLSRTARYARAVRRHAGLSAAIALAVVAILIGVVAVTVKSIRQREEREARARALYFVGGAADDLKALERWKLTHGKSPAEIREREKRVMDKLNRALAEDPTTPEVYSWLGRWFELIEEYDRAEANYNDACRRGPTSPEPFFMRAQYFVRRLLDELDLPTARTTGTGIEFAPPVVRDPELRDRALADLRKLATLVHPSGARALSESESRLAGAIEDLLNNNPAPAREALDAILRESPWMEELYGIRAMVFARLDDLESAVNDLQTLAHFWAENAEVRLKLAVYRRMRIQQLLAAGETPKKEIEAAIDDCTELLDLSPDRSTVLTLRGDHHRDLGSILAADGKDPEKMWEHAEKDYTNAIDVDAGNYLALKGRAELRGLRGRFAEAIDDAEQAQQKLEGLAGSGIKLDAKSDLAALRVTKGALWLAQAKRDPASGALRQALEELNEAVTIDETYDLAWFYRGEARVGRAREVKAPSDAQAVLSDAIDDFTEALRRSPGFWQAKLARAQANLQRGRRLKELGADARPALEAALADFDALEKIPQARDEARAGRDEVRRELGL